MRWWFWLYLTAWLPFACCLALYGARSPWWASWVGRSLMTLYGSLTAVLSLSLAVQLWPVPHAWRVLLAVLTLGAVAVAGWSQLLLIVRLQAQDRTDSEDSR